MPIYPYDPLEDMLSSLSDNYYLNSQSTTYYSTIKIEGKIEDLFKSLKNINFKLWNIEDRLRICEKNKDFGKEFIELAREVYFNNDKRSKIKSDINKILGSNIVEIKQYVSY